MMKIIHFLCFGFKDFKFQLYVDILVNTDNYYLS